jgi:hypothetical protein
VLGSEKPAISIGYEAEKLGPWDSGFTVIFDDAPDVEELDVEDEGSALVCLSCLIDDHPEIGRGLDIAREYGVSDPDEHGEWVVGDLTRLAGRS